MKRKPTPKEESGFYVQFPLSILGMALPFHIKLQSIQSFTAIHTGTRLISKMDKETREELHRKFRRVLEDQMPPWNAAIVQARLETAFSFFVGATKLEIPLNSVASALAHYDAVSEFSSQNSCFCWVRLKLEIFSGVATMNSLSEREFAVLCAIFSAVGRKSYWIVTTDEIIRRSSGYCCKDGFEQVEKNEPPLTKDQVRATVDKLYQGNLFARITRSRRKTYYSIRLTDSELRSVLEKSALWREVRRKNDRELDQRIQRKRAELRGSAANVQNLNLMVKGSHNAAGEEQ